MFQCTVLSEINADRLNYSRHPYFADTYRYRLETLSELLFPFCIVLLCMWCSDYNYNRDTESGGELIDIVTQIILWDLILYLFRMPR